jgi:DNA-binding response OmpR family regulator
MTTDDTTETADTHVLLVDDEPNVVRAYEMYLGDDYTVTTATGGRAALDAVDDTVDVVLLDRRMPDLTGDEVLAELRAAEYDCRVAMVTAVDPDFDILEMEFDAYLTKPVSKDDVTETVERLAQVDSFGELSRERVRLSHKRVTLEREKTDAQLADNDEYHDLLDRLDELDAEIAATTERMDTDAFEAAFRDLGTDRQ